MCWLAGSRTQAKLGGLDLSARAKQRQKRYRASGAYFWATKSARQAGEQVSVSVLQFSHIKTNLLQLLTAQFS